MTPEKPSKPTKLCPTCGTRVSVDAPRCLVCGADLTNVEKPAQPGKVVQGSRMPEITLSLPAILGLLVLFLVSGAGLVWFATRQLAAAAPVAAGVTETGTPTLTATGTLTPTPEPPTITPTPQPSPTPLSYVVKLGDSCGGIAISFGVSVNSIVLANPALSADCSNIFEGQTLQIPQPTPTPTELPTSTLSAAEATVAACEVVEYVVKSDDTLGKIAANYLVSKEAIAEWNGLVNDIVRFDQRLNIPLCRRESTPGPTPTATLPPPYASANLLLPADGAPFGANDTGVTLQWASVGTLRENEAYAVTLEDVTEGLGRKLVEYVNDTKFIVPLSFRPNDDTPHVIRWYVVPVRQVGADKEGNPLWEPAGASSALRVFTWRSGGGGGGAAPAPQATPSP